MVQLMTQRQLSALSTTIVRAQRIGLTRGWRRWAATHTAGTVAGVARAREGAEEEVARLAEEVAEAARVRRGLDQRIEDYHGVVSRFERHDSQRG